MSLDLSPVVVKKQPAKKRARMSSSRQTSVPQTSEDEEGATPKPRKTKRKRIPVKGLNPIPALFPSLSDQFPSLDFPAVPDKSEAPRTVFVFGNGDSGQHGLGPDKALELKQPALQKWFEERISSGGAWEGGVAKLEAGGMFTLAIDGEGKVWSWGVNDAAALGRDTAHDDDLDYTPMLVQSLQEAEFKAVGIAAGDNVGIAISELGELRAWGSFRSTEGIVAFDTAPGAPQLQFKPMEFEVLKEHSIVQVAAGNDHFLALTTTGFVFACGRGEQNQLGRKIIARHTTHGLTPERVGLRKVVLVGCGGYHSFAVSEKGTVYAWGLNSFRQLGVASESGGDEDTLSTPTEIASLHPDEHDGARVVQIVGGEHHSVFLLNNGEVYVCGRADSHVMGLPDDHPAIVASAERKTEALAARAIRQETLLAQYTAANVGEDAESPAEVANEAMMAAAIAVPTPNDYVSLPTLLSFPQNAKIISISSAGLTNFAVSTTGEVFAWGLGLSGQLGFGDRDGDAVEEVFAPTKVVSKALAGFRVLQAAAGGQHTALLAIRGEGAIPSKFQKAAPVVAKPAVEAEEDAEVNGTNGEGMVNGMEVDTIQEEEEVKEDEPKENVDADTEMDHE